MEASFGYFQKAKPNSLISNPNLIDCYSSGLIAATLMKYSQHLLQGRTNGLSVLHDASHLSRNEQILMRNEWHYELWPDPRSFHVQFQLHYDEKGFFSTDWLVLCCAAEFVSMSDLLFWRKHPLGWVGGRIGNTRSFWACTWQNWVGACRAISRPHLGQGVLSSLFLRNGFIAFPFPVSLAPYYVTGILSTQFYVPSCCEGVIRK